MDQTWVDELREFIAIPSVSADPAHEADVRRAAEWVRDFVKRAGGEAELVRVGERDLVIGEIPANANGGRSSSNNTHTRRSQHLIAPTIPAPQFVEHHARRGLLGMDHVDGVVHTLILGQPRQARRTTASWANSAAACSAKVVSSAVVYAPTPQNPACPKENCPAYPARRFQLAARMT